STTTNSGLTALSSRTNLRGRVSTGRPAVAVPTFKVPRTFSDNYALDTQSAFGIVDPNLRTPYVQQWNLSIQQEIKGNLVEVRYVGNHSTKSLHAFDYNQVQIKESGFLDDFRRAQNNGNLARAATGSF